MELSQVIANRRSIRKFSSREVTDSQIIEMIDAARFSPSSKNKQHWKYLVLKGKNKNDVAAMMETAAQSLGGKYESVLVNESCAVIRSAPVLILVYQRVCTEFVRSDLLSIGASMEHISLKAVDMGLGSLWLGDVDIAEAEISRMLNVDMPLVSALVIGYPDESPVSRPRLPVDQIMEWHNDDTVTERKNISRTSAVDGNGKYVFISYSHKDKHLVDADINELKRHGVPIWIDDTLVSGIEWNEVAIRRIQDPLCVCVIFYLSENSIISEPVAKELAATEAKFGKAKPQDKSDINALKGYFSVNIGGMAPADIYSEMKKSKTLKKDVDRGISKIFLRCFPHNKKFVPRSKGLYDFTHMEELLDVLEMYDIITPGICDEFKYEVLPDNNVRITGYIGEADRIVVKEVISGKQITEIGNNAFSYLPASSVFIPDCVSTLGEGVFLGMKNLKEIRLPRRMKHIDIACFRDTPSLKQIDLPDGISTLSEALFRGSGITAISVPDGVTGMGEAAFLDCRNLKSAIFPDTMKTMTEGGFKGCEQLETLIIPTDILGLNRNSFSDCPKIDIVIGRWHYHDGVADEVV